MKYLCIDTNIPLLDFNHIVTLGSQPDTVVCIAETVIDELDAKKSGQNELAYQARSFGRLISKAEQLGRIVTNGLTITKFKSDNAEIWIVAVNNYPDFSGVSANILNDRKIIEAAIQLDAMSPGDVTFLTNDVMCRIRAEALGLHAKDFKVVEKVDYEFTKTLIVDEDTFRNLHNKPVLEIDPKYSQENYNYKFSTPTVDQIKIATISNGIIYILGKETESELRKQDVNPQGLDQLLLTKAILDPSINLVVCEALAGSGKTLVSISSAIKLIKDKTNPFTSIIYVRSSINDVEAIEEVGFLPGDAAEKNAVYFHPLFDSLDHIARNRLRDPKAGKVVGVDLEARIEEHIEKIMKSCHITPMTGLGMRGRTFKDTVFIYDEVQNASKPSLQKALTRIGKNCKVILIGSNNQIDNPNMTKFTNGLSVILNDCATKENADVIKHVVPLQRVIRSNFAEYAERLFSKIQ